MLNMTEKSRCFLSANLPAALKTEDIGDALDMLYDLIDEKGFGPHTTTSTMTSDGKRRRPTMTCTSAIRAITITILLTKAAIAFCNGCFFIPFLPRPGGWSRSA